MELASALQATEEAPISRSFHCANYLPEEDAGPFQTHIRVPPKVFF
jgi:hypothetical protein